MKPYPTVHIAGSTGARAAVLVRFPAAKPARTAAQGERWPIYEIHAHGQILGSGHGVSNAWEQTAIALYREEQIALRTAS